MGNQFWYSYILLKRKKQRINEYLILFLMKLITGMISGTLKNIIFTIDVVGSISVLMPNIKIAIYTLLYTIAILFLQIMQLISTHLSWVYKKKIYVEYIKNNISRYTHILTVDGIITFAFMYYNTFKHSMYNHYINHINN